MKKEVSIFVQVFKLGILFTVLISPLLIWLQSTGYSVSDFRQGGLPGQNYYLLSKLTGLYALILMGSQVIYGLSKQHSSTFLLPRWTLSRHRLLGIVTLSMILVHASLFILAVSIRKQEFATGLLIPHFFKDFYHTMVSFGWLALVIVLCVMAIRIIKDRISLNWLWIHRLAIPAILFALIHALMIGSETRAGILLSIYIALGLLVVWNVIQRYRSISN